MHSLVIQALYTRPAVKSTKTPCVRLVASSPSRLRYLDKRALQPKGVDLPISHKRILPQISVVYSLTVRHLRTLDYDFERKTAIMKD